MARLTRFKITAGQGMNGTGAQVEVDGEDVSAQVVAYRLEQAGPSTRSTRISRQRSERCCTWEACDANV
jgi:hypothetical protein